MIYLDDECWAMIRKLPLPSAEELGGLGDFAERYGLQVRRSDVLNDLIFVRPDDRAYTTLSYPIPSVVEAVETLRRNFGLD